MQFGKERDTGMINVTAQACSGRQAVIAKEINTTKKDWNKGKDALRTRSQGNKELTQITTDVFQWAQGPSQAGS